MADFDRFRSLLKEELATVRDVYEALADIPVINQSNPDTWPPEVREMYDYLMSIYGGH